MTEVLTAAKSVQYSDRLDDNTVPLTAADIVARFGAMPLHRIRSRPRPGTATEADVTAILDRENVPCELIDGILLEKTLGFRESKLACLFIQLLLNFVQPRRLGDVTGPDGTIRLAPGLVRIPDVAYFSRDRLTGQPSPLPAIPSLVPDLAVEVLSPSNTPQEMAGKLRDYFAAGVRLVWFVEPRERVVEVFTSPTNPQRLTATDTLTGGTVLPGFELRLAELFTAGD